MTRQPLLPNFVEERYAQVIFEDFLFDSLAMVTPHSMLLQSAQSSPCHLVIDSGFSFTYVVPFFNSMPIKQAALRIDVGGKLLTNLFCEMISTKDFNLQGEFLIVNDIKEKTCFMAETATEFNQHMESCNAHPNKNPLKKEYLLPDFKKIKRG